MTKNFTKSFLILLVLSVLFVAYLIFRPFLTEIFVAAVLVSIFYGPFERLAKFLKGRRNLAALLMFVYGGLTWMTSSGSQERVKKGKEIIIWSAIGLIVIFGAYGLVSFIINLATNSVS